MKPKKGISVIICTYNGELLIQRTITCILDQLIYLDQIPYEILIVDNNSSDTTRQIVLDIIRTYEGFSIQLLKENRRGKINALALGLNNAQYDYVIICDDDNRLRNNYLQKVSDIMSDHEDVGVVLGQGFPDLELDAPDWFEYYKNGYAIGPQSSQTGYSQNKYYFYSAGMCIRLSAFHRIKKAGFENILTGRTGKQLTAGEDSELVCALLMAGYKVWYDEGLVFDHFISGRKLNLDYAVKLYQGFAQADIVISAYRYLLIANKIASPWQWLILIYQYLAVTSTNQWFEYAIKGKKSPSSPVIIYTISIIKELIGINFGFRKLVIRINRFRLNLLSE